ncbi:nuclease-related domain-containing protein [Motilimonas cestriensis]|uniref:nuclease-related domain-containing protein n=1 Tax=Motilimonas cestriensis TaxID=2742685 RepID=UPI003DA31BC9
MICKDKDNQTTNSIKLKAGIKQEQDVAFFLKRAFGDSPNIMVFNDLKLHHQCENAQIDHLVLYPYGFVLIESKSITGHVKVNQHSEWQRSYKGNWSGMRSPIKQVELQQHLLRQLLHHHKQNILPKMLFGKVQQSFGGRCWDNICAISSNAIIDRGDMPAKLEKQVVKSEFVVDKLKQIMDLPSGIFKALKPTTRPEFSGEDMQAIKAFLLSQHQGDTQKGSEQTPTKTTELAMAAPTEAIISEQNEPAANEQIAPPQPAINNSNKSVAKAVTFPAKVEPKPRPAVTSNEIATKHVKCKKCGATSQLTAAYGKYGYYVICGVCETNTAMKMPCPACNSKNTKVAKKRDDYSVNCSDCETTTLIYQQDKQAAKTA